MCILLDDEIHMNLCITHESVHFNMKYTPIVHYPTNRRWSGTESWDDFSNFVNILEFVLWNIRWVAGNNMCTHTHTHTHTNSKSHENPSAPGANLKVLETISRFCAILSAIGCTLYFTQNILASMPFLVAIYIIYETVNFIPSWGCICAYMHWYILNIYVHICIYMYIFIYTYICIPHILFALRGAPAL